MRQTKHRSSSTIVSFVGISSKPGVDRPIAPLSDETLSGRIISDVEARLRKTPDGRTFFRDNLVKTPPLHKGKLRYPTKRELKSEWAEFDQRLTRMRANVVVLLGGIVSQFFRSKRVLRVITCPFADGLLLKWVGIDESGRLVLAVAHPSYIGIYARKRRVDYADAIFHTIQGFLQGTLHVRE